MQVQHGAVCPEGFLPVYSVDDEKTAKLLIASCCELGLDGEHYARELFDPETHQPYTDDKRIEGFVKFGKRLEKTHKLLSSR